MAANTNVHWFVMEPVPQDVLTPYVDLMLNLPPYLDVLTPPPGTAHRLYINDPRMVYSRRYFLTFFRVGADPRVQKVDLRSVSVQDRSRCEEYLKLQLRLGVESLQRHPSHPPLVLPFPLIRGQNVNKLICCLDSLCFLPAADVQHQSSPSSPPPGIREAPLRLVVIQHICKSRSSRHTGYEWTRSKAAQLSEYLAHTIKTTYPLESLMQQQQQQQQQ